MFRGFFCLSSGLGAERLSSPPGGRGEGKEAESGTGNLPRGASSLFTKGGQSPFCLGLLRGVSRA